MFYEVKVFDSRGQLKKVVSSKKLSNRFWRNNENTSPYFDEGYSKSEEWGVRSNSKAYKLGLDGSL